MLVPVDVEPHHLIVLERLLLLEPSERDKGEIAWAIARFLDAGLHHAGAADALWPDEDEPSEDA
jgi:hypothetical protein